MIGGGPIGLELAQAMQRFGCQVTVLIRSGEIMPKVSATRCTDDGGGGDRRADAGVTSLGRSGDCPRPALSRGCQGKTSRQRAGVKARETGRSPPDRISAEASPSRPLLGAARIPSADYLATGFPRSANDYSSRASRSS